MSPILAMWVMETMRGKIPKLEQMEPLRLKVITRRQFQEQSSIRWEKFAEGRVVRGVVCLQEWWQSETKRKGAQRDEDPTKTVAQAIDYGLLYRYELWKMRCT